MLHTVEAEIDVNGNVRLLEPVNVTKTTRALVTLLDYSASHHEASVGASSPGNAAALLELLRSPEFANRPSYSAEEIEAQIQENRESWD